ncbi:peptidoglycan D,D-transpeptidase FtsI family protein [Candidatus Gromoviella agglomerans]|uniref:peptidoglycan D,D-transpeptidase FtsI family protein n=1 Tax=Candidatus Gromoviella agglomerans TaxID=2806609 RepID=UPI001E51E496|nr:penicillin-binding transpeptidase domain-containing protein [Candidatus Gromoviella agglomerans]
MNNTLLENDYGKQRPTILDRQGVIIAKSALIRSVYANPSKIQDKSKVIADLMKVFPQLNRNELKKKLYSTQNFVWIVKNITKNEEHNLLRLKLDFIEVRKNYARIYPHGRLFSHVIGYVNVDQNGVTGLEKWVNSVNDSVVISTLDIAIQHVLHNEISYAVNEFGAEWGGAIVADIDTGEILGMVSYPDFDPHKINSPFDKCMFNQMTAGIYEFGSIMKIFNLALCVAHGDPNKEYDVSSNLTIGSFTIRDITPFNGSLNIVDGFSKSSNICYAKAALDIGGEKQRKFLESLNLFDQINLEISEVGKPSKPSHWSKSTIVTASYGYGISLTPLNVLHGLMKLLNPNYDNLKLVRNAQYNCEKSQYQYSSNIAKLVIHCLNNNAKKWHSKGISDHQFGGKTGTANIIQNKKYVQKKNIVSFVCIFPSYKPKYAMIVMFGAPKPSQSTFGFATSVWFTLPVARNIINILMNSRLAFEK